MALDSQGQYVPRDVVAKNQEGAGLDASTRKLLFPSDPRGTQGIISRGRNVYKGGLPSPTNPNMNPRNGKLVQNPYQRLAEMRLKGLI